MAKSPGNSEEAQRHAKQTPPPFIQLLRSQAGMLVTLFVLAGIGVWGYLTEWRITGVSSILSRNTNTEKPSPDRQMPSGSVRVVPPPATDPKCPLAKTRIEFPSVEAFRRVGILTAPAEQKQLVLTISAPGEVDYDPTRMARLSTPVPGRVWRLEKEIGQRVRKGEVLALIDSAEVGKAKADFMQSVTQVALKARILESLQSTGGAVAGRKVLEAEADLRDSRVRLFNTEQALVNLGLPIKGKDVEQLTEEQLAKRVRFLGLPESVVADIDTDTATSNLLPVRAPFDGVVTERNTSQSEVVDATKILFVVADLSRVWIIVNVRQEDADKLAIDQSLVFQPDGHPGEVIRGKISWFSTIVDEKTRTIRARAVVENPKAHLAARTFGAAKITIRDAPQAIVVPAAAVQREERCRFVFVRLGDQLFELRRVELGIASGSDVEIVEGVRLGDVVATTGSFMLKSEVLKGRLGEAD